MVRIEYDGRIHVALKVFQMLSQHINRTRVDLSLLQETNALGEAFLKETELYKNYIIVFIRGPQPNNHHYYCFAKNPVHSYAWYDQSLTNKGRAKGFFLIYILYSKPTQRGDIYTDKAPTRARNRKVNLCLLNSSAGIFVQY
jgi:hypothetical protein